MIISGHGKTIPTASYGFPRKLNGTESTCQAEDAGLISGSGRSPGEGNGNPLQFLPGKSHGQRNLGSPRVRHNLATGLTPPQHHVWN